MSRLMIRNSSAGLIRVRKVPVTAGSIFPSSAFVDHGGEGTGEPLAVLAASR
jgi:hypothetical protein